MNSMATAGTIMMQIAAFILSVRVDEWVDDVAVNFSLESADELMTAVGLREKLGEKRRGATPLRRNSPRQHSARCSPSTFGVVKLIFFSVVQRLSPLPVQTDEVACHMACRFSPLPRLPPLYLPKLQHAQRLPDMFTL